ncbi:aminotransferase class IV [Actinoplanes sp. NPDC051411]|uniref:aminotransferase class IV n=1 Tax=Actinoplanes sp. NPDC051411 TaxID=3155522 RepID=UPI003440EEDF
MPTIELNGRAPDVAAIQRLATWNYGHFTSMQVRGFAVRGLALHLARLSDGNEEFFDYRTGIDDEQRVLDLIRHALGDEADASVRVGFVPPAERGAPPDILVSVSDPAPDAAGPPLRVRTDGYRRDWPAHKHAATMGLTYAALRARRAGYDDALFVGADNLVSEGTTWNVAFYDGDRVIWPQAPMLKGVTMVLLQLALSMNSTPWTLRPVDAVELPLLAGAAAVNSIWPAQPIGSIDGVPFPADDKLVSLLREAWESVPFDAL